ncbi:MAG: hypothetical protein Q9208_006305 [Pyrenodesmia sp. 3 TL-2023]
MTTQVRSLQRGFHHSGEYESVNVLLVYWEDDDLGCLEEVNAIKSLFEHAWHYDVHMLSIPTERSQAALQSDLSQFCNINSRQRKGGPTLNWYEVQPVVFAAEGDVLLVLDCCYAAQAARGRESRTIELLAASGVKQRTPPPGDSPFTAVLMKVMKRMLQKAGHVVVHKLYEELFKETDPHEELFEQPFHFFIAEGGGSIVLKPRQKPGALDQTQNAWPSALLSLTVSLSQKPDRSTMRRLGVWLKTAVPRTISSVDVERILLRTETIQEFILARRDSGLRTAIQTDLGQSEQSERVGLMPPLSRTRAPLHGSRKEAEDVLFALKVWNDQVYQSMERHLLLDPGFASHKSLTENVVFLYSSDDTSSGKADAKEAESSVLPLDLDDPRLFGFEAARPRDAISSQTREFHLSRLLYTHPERWGRPGVNFGALHDIYALGVTLLEVGCWKPALRMDRRGRGFGDRRNENDVRDDLLAVAREQLPHLTGESFSQAVIACLDGSLADGLKEGSEGLGLHQAFGKRVLIPLGRCTYA